MLIAERWRCTFTAQPVYGGRGSETAENLDAVTLKRLYTCSAHSPFHPCVIWGGKAPALVCEKTTKVNTGKNRSSAALRTLHCPFKSATSFPNECLSKLSESDCIFRAFRIAAGLVESPSSLNRSPVGNVSSTYSCLPLHVVHGSKLVLQSYGVCKREVGSNLGAHRSARERHDFLVLVYRTLKRGPKAAFKVVGDF